MPVDFLTREQEQRYGRFTELPTPAQLARYFHLDDFDLKLLEGRRGDHNRLGMALQLCTLRFLGTFLTDPIDVPDQLIGHLAGQLNIDDCSALPRYREGEMRWRHQGLIRGHYDYRDFNSQPFHFQLVRWLYIRAWLSNERPTVLFDLATNWLVERKIVLPGVSVLARLVASVRDRAAARLWQQLASLPSPEQKVQLENLLLTPKDASQTPLDRLRRSPTRLSAQGLSEALMRLVELRQLGMNQLKLSSIPLGRMSALARYASAARTQAISRMGDERRLATLIAFAHFTEIAAQDEAVELLDQLLHSWLSKSERHGHRERLRTLKDLDGAALDLRQACQVLVDDQFEDHQVREVVFNRLTPERLRTALEVVERLAQQPDEAAYYEQLLQHYPSIRRFLPQLLTTLKFKGNRAGQPVLEALAFLKSIEGQRHISLKNAPRGVVNKAWQKYVLAGHHSVHDRRYYTWCVLERLQHSLKRRDIYLEPSERWADPGAKLLQGDNWKALKPQVARTLNRKLDNAPELETMQRQLEEAYLRTAQGLKSNQALRIEERGGVEVPVLTPLEKLEEPESLLQLRYRVASLLPRVDLAELVLEVANWTGFAQEFTHISEGNARAEDLHLSVCAVLVSEACNIGLEPLIRNDWPAMRHERLSWVQQNYIRAETLTRANARLVDQQAKLKLAKSWGGGEVASADGLRFVVPVRSLNAGPNSKYFGTGRGVTYYNYTSDQFTGFHAIVIPGTLRDSIFILDGLLEQQTSLQPTQIMTDTAAYSDVVFGLFWLLGYQFSPRLADTGGARFWRFDNSTSYRALDGIARHRLNSELIGQNWDDLLRVAGSLKLGTVSASEFMRSLQAGGRVTTLSKAIAEVGRVAKTIHLLTYLDDENYRRSILTQLNRGESRHNLARTIFYGQKGELRQRYREGQEDQLGALGLVANTVVLWNTRYMELALDYLRNKGVEVRDEDVARLSPLGHAHINMLGRYQLILDEAILQGNFRPLNNLPLSES